MGTVRAVAKLGYQIVEFYSPYYSWTPSQASDVRKLLDDLGIQCRSTHNDNRVFITGTPAARNASPYSPSSITETIIGSNRDRSSRVTTRNSIASAPPTARPVVTKLIRRGRGEDAWTVTCAGYRAPPGCGGAAPVR